MLDMRMYQLIIQHRVVSEGDLESLVQVVETLPAGHYQITESSRGWLFAARRLWGMAIRHTDGSVELKRAPRLTEKDSISSPDAAGQPRRGDQLNIRASMALGREKRPR